MPLAMNGQKDLIEVPLVPGLGASPLEVIGIVLPKFPTPLPDRFMGDLDTPSQHHLFHIAVTQAKAVIQPDAMADDLSREAMVLIPFSLSRRGHVWRPHCGIRCITQGHHGGEYRIRWK